MSDSLLQYFEKIAPNPTLLSITFLAISWMFLLSSLVLSLFATSKSQSAIQRQIVLLDAEYKPLLYPESSAPEDSNADKSNPYIGQIKLLDVWARHTLVLGLVCLCVFAVVNVMNKDTTNASKNPDLQTQQSINPASK